MTRTEDYQPRAEHKFSFGLWTVGNRGRDPFGDFVRPPFPPKEIVSMLAEVGAWGVNLHDNDLVPIDATACRTGPHRVRSFQEGLQGQWNCRARWPLCRSSSIPCFATERSPRMIPRCAPTRFRKPCGRWILARNSARRFLSCGVAAKAWRPMPAAGQMKRSKRLREAINYLCEYNIDREIWIQVCVGSQAQRAARRYLHGHHRQYLGFIPTLDHPEMVGVNPEVAHEQMAGLNFMHAVAQAWEAGQTLSYRPERSNAGPLRSGSSLWLANLKSAFWLVKFLEDVGYARAAPLRCACLSHRRLRRREGFRPRVHANLSDPERKSARHWNADKEIQGDTGEISAESERRAESRGYSKNGSSSLLAHAFDKDAILKKSLPYEGLDQLTVDLLLGVR